jgi:hypothetical protein
MQPVVLGNEKFPQPVTGYQGPPIAVATPVYPQQPTQYYQQTPPQHYQQTPQHYQQQPQVNTPSFTGEAKVQHSGNYLPPVLPESNTCQCQGQKDYMGAWRFPFDNTDRGPQPKNSDATSSELILACCDCQGYTKMDVRNFVFPPHGNVTLKTSGCQSKLQMYIPADVQVNVALPGAATRQRDKRSKEAKAGMQPIINKFITIKNNEKCCCVCQPSVDIVKLDQGQEPPKDCVIM